MKAKIIFIFYLICIPFLVYSQSQSTEVVKINGQLYYMHTIKEGETLDNIAKIYNVAKVDVIENNPTLQIGSKLRSGMRLRIPDLTDITKKYPLSDWEFTYYQVKSQVKLKDIAKEYDIEVKDIKNNNPDISNKPAILSKIRIPLKKGSKVATLFATKLDNDTMNNTVKANPALSFDWSKDTVSKKENEGFITFLPKQKDCSVQEYNPKNESYTISFLLPLKLDESSKKDFTYFSFLEGALLAVEQMKNEGFSAKISINDAYSNATLNKALTSDDVKNSDLLIGPFSDNGLNIVSKYSDKNKIPLVSPYNYNSEALAKDNPYFIQIYPAKSSIEEELFLKSKKDTPVNVVLIYPIASDSSMLELYHNELKKIHPNYSIYEHKMGLRPDNVKVYLGAKLKKDILNILFVASNDEAFVSDLMDRLMIFNNEKYPISLYGTMAWRKNFKMVKLLSYYSLNLHVMQPFFIDYDDENVKTFILNYRKTYNNEPTQYAFQGYDVTYYFLTALKKYGKNFMECLHSLNVNLLQSTYKFEQIYGEKGGYVNTNSYLLEYSTDMNIVKH